MTRRFVWPYPVQWDEVRHVRDIDVLVLGGGVAGCWAAIGAARAGARVALVEKASTIRSGAAGSGCDHWESCATNPNSGVTPEQLTGAMISDNNGYNNGISHYIETREGWDRILDIEDMGAKVRDTENEFAGAEFRDDDTGFLYAYDYENKFTIRIWGTTFKETLYRGCKRAGVKIFDRTMGAALLTERGEPGARIAGAIGVDTRTGQQTVFHARSVVLAMSRPTRIWLFIPDLPGLSEFRPPQCTGDGHAMAWRAGAELTMMEKSVKAEWSGDRSYPPYGTGNNHNTWFACTMVDADGRELPYLDRDRRVVQTVRDRYYPAPGQHFFIKGGGESEFPSYDYLGADTPPVKQLVEDGYQLPFYADLPSMPELERKAIWGLMVGQEGKTRIPVYRTYTDAGFDPDKDLLRSYGDGWKSATFRPQERQLFGLVGGLVNDWNLATNVEGLYAAGDQLFASNCHGHAAATGHYAGRHAAEFAKQAPDTELCRSQALSECARLRAPIGRGGVTHWKQLAFEISRLMQQRCGASKTERGLLAGLDELREIERTTAARVSAANPHELVRVLETLSVLSNAELVIHSCLARKASAKQLHFFRDDYPQLDPPQWHKFVTVRRRDGNVVVGELPIDYYGDLQKGYEAHNRGYVAR